MHSSFQQFHEQQQTTHSFPTIVERFRVQYGLPPNSVETPSSVIESQQSQPPPRSMTAFCALIDPSHLAWNVEGDATCEVYAPSSSLTSSSTSSCSLLAHFHSDVVTKYPELFQVHTNNTTTGSSSMSNNKQFLATGILTRGTSLLPSTLFGGGSSGPCVIICLHNIVSIFEHTSATKPVTNLPPQPQTPRDSFVVQSSGGGNNSYDTTAMMPPSSAQPYPYHQSCQSTQQQQHHQPLFGSAVVDVTPKATPFVPPPQQQPQQQTYQQSFSVSEARQHPPPATPFNQSSAAAAPPHAMTTVEVPPPPRPARDDDESSEELELPE